MSGTIKGVFHNALTTLALPGTEGEVRINPYRALLVRLTDDSGAYVAPGGGTTDQAAWTNGSSTFNPIGGVYNDSATALTAGKQGTARLTNNRALHVNVRDSAGNEATLTGNSLNVNVTNGAAGGTSMADKAAFTVGTTNGTPAFGLVRTDVPDLVVDATGASLASTLRRGLHVNLRTQAGVELLGQQTMAASIPVAIASNQGNLPTNVAQINGVTPLMGSGVMGTGSLRVTIASDNDAVTVKQGTAANLKVEATIAAAQTLATVTNLVQLNGAAIAMNTGVRAAGVQRVTICTDDVVPASQSGTWNIGTVTTVSAVSALTCAAANAKVDIGLINAVTPLMGSGVMGTGSLRVTIASDNDALTVKQDTASNLKVEAVGNVAHDSAVSGNPVRTGGRARTTALVTAVAADDVTDIMTDEYGRILKQGAFAAGMMAYQTPTAIANTTETTIVTADANNCLDIVWMCITNNSDVQSIASLRDATAGTVRMKFLVPARGGITFAPSVPLPQTTKNNNWTLQQGTTATSTDVSVLFGKRPT